MKLNLFFTLILFCVNLITSQPRNLERKKRKIFHPTASFIVFTVCTHLSRVVLVSSALGAQGQAHTKHLAASGERRIVHSVL